MSAHSQQTKNDAPLRLMAVLAHPDDESLGLGGVLAKYAAEGVATYLVTATRGEGGRYHEHRDGPGHPGRERLGEIRESEVRCAAQELGVRDLWLLGYKDGGLDEADPRAIVSEIAGRIREARPQVVLTFPPTARTGTRITSRSASSRPRPSSRRPIRRTPRIRRRRPTRSPSSTTS